MKTIELSKATSQLRDYAESAAKEMVVVTRNGKPLAAVVSLEGIDLESFSLSMNPKFIQIMEKSRESARIHGALTSDEVRKKLGIKRKVPKRSR
jgi:prevent-host-death family protein